jgi:hypothetical protein
MITNHISLEGSRRALSNYISHSFIQSLDRKKIKKKNNTLAYTHPLHRPPVRTIRSNIKFKPGFKISFRRFIETMSDFGG